MEPNLPTANTTTSPKRHCLICNDVIRDGSYCKKHKPEHQQGRWGTSNNDSFYHTTKWRKVSKKYRRLNPYCEQCGHVPPTIGLLDCDHITPIEEGGHKYSFENLQSLCKPCHANKTKNE